jgi:glycosyltransferase involved in cell wall biosynthesis
LPSAPLERRSSPNRVVGRGGRRPLAVVVHTTDGDMDGSLAWMTDPASGVAAHYLVGLDGRTVQLVDEGDAARHAGRVLDPTAPLILREGGDPNLYTVGVELDDAGDPGARRPDAQYSAAARLIAAAASRWGFPIDREHVIGHREVFAAKECPGSVDLERLAREAAAQPCDAAEGLTGGSIACLTPARNAARDVEGLLASAARFADLVIALDDGSTDDTAALLEASPLVARLLRNPVRETYAGWDDAANRQQLLDAALELGVDWVLFLDADERIDAADGAALRDFVDTEADPGCAYGLRVHRMIGDEQRFDTAGLWAYRLFSPRPGARLPADRLHAVPIPIEIPRERWLQTTIRIQHLASLSAERRRHRLAKYEQADPERRWQGDYSELVREPGELTDWRSRAAGLPVLVDADGAEELDLDAPVLSAIVIAREDEATIESSVRSVVEQECTEAFEVIVVVSGSPATARVVRGTFPGIRLVELSEPVLPGAARNAGLAVARGEYISFPGSHVELRPGSLAARLRAHERGHAMVTGSILNGTTTRAGWAAYFLDHSSALPGRPSGVLSGAPAHCSYARAALRELDGFPEELRAGEDTVVNQELFRRGYDAYRAHDVELVHRSRCTTPRRLVRHHFQRGMAMTRVMRSGDLAPPGGRLALARFLAGYSRRRLDETGARVMRWGPELWPEYSRARPLVVAGVLAALAGACVEAVRPRGGRSSR